MDTREERQKQNIIKSFFLGLFRKEFLVFLCFLVISTAFWFLSALNEPHEAEIRVPLKVVGIPDKVIVTDNLPDTVLVTVRDKGFNLLHLTFFDGMPELQLNFRNCDKGNGKGTTSAADIQKILRPFLSETASIISVKAEHWDFYYSYGTKKKVPVVLNAALVPRSNYYVSYSDLSPDSVVVYASEKALDTINVVYTQHVQKEDITQAETMTVALQKIHGAKIIPESVKLSIGADQLTEITMHVPVKTINVPANISLKTFPSTVEVRVTVGLKSVNSVKAESFSVIADFKDLPQSHSDKIPLRLTMQPKGIVKATLKTTQADYIIEQ